MTSGSAPVHRVSFSMMWDRSLGGRAWWAGLGVAVLAALVPSPAHAARAEVLFTPGGGSGRLAYEPEERLSVVDTVSERNVLSATSDGSSALITDAAAPLEAGPGCIRVSLGQVRCALRLQSTSMELSSGGGDDVLDARMSPRGFSFRGGEGDDELWLSPGGGSGYGGPGADVIHGGPGNDAVIDSESTGRDIYDLGGGSNSLYYTRGEPVVIDLAAGAGGAADGEDTLAGVTTAQGGNGNDVLRGTDAGEELNGGSGSDRIEGRGGADRLYGGIESPGHNDTILGGDGKDRIEAAPLGSITADGGQGDDVIVGGEKQDLVQGGPGRDVIGPFGRDDRADGGSGDDHVSVTSSDGRQRCGSGRDVASETNLSARPGTDCEQQWIMFSTRIAGCG